MRKITIILTLLLSKLVPGQNLVPNPGFEIMDRIPINNDNGTNCAKGWFCPIGTFGDYYNRASKSKNAEVPKNHFGYQEPHSGDGYAGICIENGMIEYLETELTDTLIKGKSYFIEFYVSKSDRLGNVNEFGIMFSDKLEYISEMNGISYKPDVNFVNETGFKDEEGWTKLSIVYVAKGFEKVIVLGYFNYEHPNTYKGKAHYYIDDVSIIPIEQKESTR